MYSLYLTQFCFNAFDTTYFLFIKGFQYRKHDERELSALVTNMKMTNIDKENPLHICKTQDILDD